MERRIPKPVEIYNFVQRQEMKISAVVAGGAVVVAPFLDGRLDKFVGAVGATTFSYGVLRIFRERINGRNIGKNDKLRDK